MSVNEQLNRWDADHSWHPFTQMAEYLQFPPLHIARGEGCWLFDDAGNRYLDGNASIWTNVHGHNDPELNEALIGQMEKMAHSTYLGLSHGPGAELGNLLAELAPDGLERVFYSDNGSCAIEAALKMSMQYWQLKGLGRKRLAICFEGGYHGDTFGAMSVSKNRFNERFAPWLFESIVIPSPWCEEYDGISREEEDGESLACLEKVLQERSGEIACLVMEPLVQGAAGMRLQPRRFLQKVERLCKEYEVHLIFDEVFVAFGRLGSMLVCENEGIKPDFLCLAKGLTAGYLPMAATLVQTEIYDAFLGRFEEGKAFFHGHTFTGHPLAAAVALANIKKLKKLIASGQLRKTIDFFGRLVAEYFGVHEQVREIRQRGLTAAIDLYPGGDELNQWPVEKRVGLAVCMEARNFEVLLRPLGDSILIVPPLVINEQELEHLFQGLLKAIETVVAKQSTSQRLQVSNL